MGLKQRILDKLHKEFDKGADKGTLKNWEEWIERAVDLTFEEIKKEIDEIEEGFEGTAVEFCEKHGNASYTGFVECLKEIKSRIK